MKDIGFKSLCAIAVGVVLGWTLYVTMVALTHKEPDRSFAFAEIPISSSTRYIDFPQGCSCVCDDCDLVVWDEKREKWVPEESKP